MKRYEFNIGKTIFTIAIASGNSLSEKYWFIKNIKNKKLVFQFKNNKYVVDCQFGKDGDGLEGYNIFPYTINSNLKEKPMTNHQNYQDTYPIKDKEIIAEMLRFNSKDPEVEYLNNEESDSLQEMLDNMYETEYRLVRRYFSDIKNEKSDLGNL